MGGLFGENFILDSIAIDQTTTLAVEHPGYLLDQFPNAALAFSLRKLRDAYNGPVVRLRRSYDGSHEDFGFTSQGDFDSGAVARWLMGGDAYVRIWYDQSGNGLHITQTTVANQPIYTANGIGGLPSAYLPTSGQRMSVSTNVFAGTSQGTFISAMNPSSGTNRVLFGWHPAGYISCNFIWNTSIVNFTFGTDGVSGTIPAWNEDTIIELFRDASDNQAIVWNGDSLVSEVKTADNTTGTQSFWLSMDASGTSSIGKVAEVVSWTTDLGDVNRAATRANLAAYYGITVA